MHVSIHYFYVNIKSFALYQLVAIILQSGIIKPPQQKSTQDDVINRTPFKSQTVDVVNLTEI